VNQVTGLSMGNKVGQQWNWKAPGQLP
jgi:hypothetical protein